MVKNVKISEIDPRKLLGERLAKLRKERGWSQEQLALESGIARSYLGGVERGQRNIALLNICKLADTLGIEPSELMKFS
jgi:transcriptional regulator with XRE-family HTH domain